MSSAVRSCFASDRRSVALFRALLGVLLAADLVGRFGLIDTLYANEGVLTNHFALFRPVAPPGLSLLHAFSLARDVRWVFALWLAIDLLFAMGARTRVAQVLSLVFVVSLHARNPLAELPSDAVLTGLVWWSLLLPVADRFSLDHLLRGALHRARPGELDVRPPPEQPFFSLAVFGAQLWVAALHAALTVRRAGPLWRDGEGLAYALGDGPWVTAFGTWLRAHAAPSVLSVMSYAFWLSPLLIALALLVPSQRARRGGLIGLLAYHLACALLWRDVVGELALCAAAPLWLTAADWQRMGAWRAAQRRNLLVVYDGDCGVCFVICRLLSRLDGYQRLAFLPSSSAHVPVSIPGELLARTVVVVDRSDDRVFTQSRAVLAVIGALPLGRPLAWLLGRRVLARSLDRAYDAFATRRARVSQWLGWGACGIEAADARATAGAPAIVAPGARPPLGAALRELGAIALAALTLWSVARSDRLASTRRPERMTLDQTALRYLGVVPARDRLAPEPARWSGTLVVEGTTASGALARDFASGGGPPITAYFDRIRSSENAPYVDGLREHVKRVAGARPDPVTTFAIVWVASPIPARGQPAATEPTRTRLASFP